MWEEEAAYQKSSMLVPVALQLDLRDQDRRQGDSEAGSPCSRGETQVLRLVLAHEDAWL